MRRVIGFFHVLGFLALLPPSLVAAQESVDLELVLLSDASRSIDDAEARFQRGGYASALTDPRVLDAIASGYDGRIAVTYVEWGDMTSQDIVVPWTIIDGLDTAKAFAAALMAAPRRANGPNAIGEALVAAHDLILDEKIEGFRKVIDFSADSVWNGGYVPVRTARAAILADGITINGLAILCRLADCSGRPVYYSLEDAFDQRIVGGNGHFVVTADGREQFAAAVRRKLLLEIAGRVPEKRPDIASRSRTATSSAPR